MSRVSSRDIVSVIFLIFAVVILFSVSHRSDVLNHPSADFTSDTSNEDVPFSIIDAPDAKPAPGFALTTPEGQSFDLSSATKSGPVVIDFWAIWCGPCRMEMPILDDLYRKYSAQGVQFFGVNSDADAASVKRFFSKESVGFPILLDKDGNVNKVYGIKNLPTVMVIDRAGRVRAFDVGYDPTTNADLSNCLDTLLKE